MSKTKTTDKKIFHETIQSSHALHPQRMLAERIVDLFHNSKKIAVITGAGNYLHLFLVTFIGISVSGGIPDFRSSDGLYNMVKQKYPNAVLKGKDLFDANVLKYFHFFLHRFLSFSKTHCQLKFSIHSWGN